MAAWTVRVTPKAERGLARLSGQDRARVYRFLHERIPALIDPRALGAALTGRFSGQWKYRVGDIRIIAEIRDKELVILVIEVGNRREVYR